MQSLKLAAAPPDSNVASVEDELTGAGHLHAVHCVQSVYRTHCHLPSHDEFYFRFVACKYSSCIRHLPGNESEVVVDVLADLVEHVAQTACQRALGQHNSP